MRQIIKWGETEWNNESTGGIPRIGERIIIPNGFLVKVESITRDICKQIITVNCSDYVFDSKLISEIRELFRQELINDDCGHEKFIKMFDSAAKKAIERKGPQRHRHPIGQKG